MDVPSYGKVYSLGHAAIKALFDGVILAEEKIDGSQLSFMRVGDEVFIRSHRKQLVLDGPLGMFELAVKSVKDRAHWMQENWIYRGEFLNKPRHNHLCYDRVPEGNIIIWDVDTNGGQNYLSWTEKQKAADDIGLEVVPMLYEGEVKDLDQLMELMELPSGLGGSKIEGIVFKNYSRFCPDGKIMMGKHVSEQFKESQRITFRAENPTQGDILQRLIVQYRTPARWAKAVQHLKEDGVLTDSPKDIGPLLKELNKDIEEECREEIKEYLYKWARKEILRGAGKGLPEWYKEQLATKQFE